MRPDTMQDVSATVAFLRSGTISILHAIAAELPDVFGAEVLPRLNLQDTLNLAQTSKLFRDTVWSVRGVQSMRAKIAAGEEVDTRKTLKGQTTLHLAVLRRKRSVVDLLLDAGADTKIRDNAGRTVLHLAADQSDGS